MLFALQIPIADVRGFKPELAATRVRKPSAPPKPFDEFTRCFGCVLTRRSIQLRQDRKKRRGNLKWNDGTHFCEALNTIKYLDITGDESLHAAGFTGCLRRLISDRSCVVRVEIGVKTGVYSPLDDNAFFDLLRRYLDVDTQVVRFLGDPVKRGLLLQDKELARQYCRATTRVSRSPSTAQQGVYPCRPLLLAEYESDDVDSSPRGFEWVRHKQMGDVKAGCTVIRIQGRTLVVWLIERPSSSMRASADIAERVGACVLRLHAEHEVLVQVLRLLAGKSLGYEPDTPEGNALADYLNRASRYLSRTQSYGVEQAYLYEVVRAYGSYVAESERDDLNRQLEGVFRQVREKVRRFATPPKASAAQHIEVLDGGIYIAGPVEHLGDSHMQTTNITFGDNNSFQGDVIAAGMIQKSFNKAAEAKAEGLQQALEELTVQVSSLCESFHDNEEQQRVSRRLKAFVDEAASAKPDGGFLQTTGQAIIDAAKTVAAMASPVAGAVKVVMQLLGLA